MEGVQRVQGSVNNFYQLPQGSGQKLVSCQPQQIQHFENHQLPQTQFIGNPLQPQQHQIVGFPSPQQIQQF